MVAAPFDATGLGQRLETVVRHGLIAVLPWFVFVPFLRIFGTPLSADDFIPLVLVFLGVLARLLGRGPRYEAVTVGLILLGVLSLGSAIVNAESDGHLVRMIARSTGRFFFYAGLMVTALTCLRDDEDVLRLLRWIVITGVVQGLFCCWAYYTNTMGPFGFGVAPTPEWTTLRRVHGTFATNEGAVPVSANFLGAYMMCTTLVASGLALLERRGRSLVWLAASAVCAAGLALSFTRASVYGVLLGIAVLSLLSRRVAGVPALLVLVAFSIGPSPLGKRMTSFRSDRQALSTAALRIAEEHPVLGIGDGNYQDVLTSSSRYYETPHGKATSSPHNSLLLATLHAGPAAGLCLLVIVLLALGRGVLAALWARGERQRILLASLAAPCVAFFLQSLTNDLLFVPKNAVFFWLFIALSLVVARAPSAVSHDPA